ncbi:hypothetical protein DL991_39675 [Amycolatopsis sp. WAC 01375]|nr:hypothetical protein DL991_39675 [Amycolatopsis sp. WAC 01375]
MPGGRCFVTLDLGGTYYNTKPRLEALETLLWKLPDPSTPGPSPVNRPKLGRARQLDALQTQALIDGYLNREWIGLFTNPVRAEVVPYEEMMRTGRGTGSRMRWPSISRRPAATRWPCTSRLPCRRSSPPWGATFDSQVSLPLRSTAIRAPWTVPAGSCSITPMMHRSGVDARRIEKSALDQIMGTGADRVPPYLSREELPGGWQETFSLAIPWAKKRWRSSGPPIWPVPHRTIVPSETRQHPNTVVGSIKIPGDRPGRAEGASGTSPGSDDASRAVATRPARHELAIPCPCGNPGRASCSDGGTSASGDRACPLVPAHDGC